MAVSYKKLWKLLIDRNMNKTELKQKQEMNLNFSILKDKIYYDANS